MAVRADGHDKSPIPRGSKELFIVVQAADKSRGAAAAAATAAVAIGETVILLCTPPLYL